MRPRAPAVKVLMLYTLVGRNALFLSFPEVKREATRLKLKGEQRDSKSTRCLGSSTSHGARHLLS